MSQNIFSIHHSQLFPWHFQFLAALAFIGAFPLFGINVYTGAAFLAGSLFVFTGSSGLQIDPANKRYREYYSFFFLKTGSWNQYQEIEKLYINTSRVSQRMHSRAGNSATYSDTKFNGYIKFDNGEKIQLFSKRNKSAVLAGVNDIASQLNVHVEDVTPV